MVGSNTSFNIFGNVSTKSGFRSQIDLSFTDETFLEIEATQNVIEDANWGTLSLGAYYSNFSRLNRGIVSRIANARGGGIIKYVHPNNQFSVDAKLGVANNGLEAAIASEFQFQF